MPHFRWCRGLRLLLLRAVATDTSPVCAVDLYRVIDENFERVSHGQVEIGGVSAIVHRPGSAFRVAGTALAIIAQVATSPCVPPGMVIV